MLTARTARHLKGHGPASICYHSQSLALEYYRPRPLQVSNAAFFCFGSALGHTWVGKKIAFDERENHQGEI